MATTVALPDDQATALQRYCERMNLSPAEVLERALARLMDPEIEPTPMTASQRDAALVAAFGIWKDRGVDTDTYLDRIRAEFER